MCAITFSVISQLHLRIHMHSLILILVNLKVTSALKFDFEGSFMCVLRILLCYQCDLLECALAYLWSAII